MARPRRNEEPDPAPPAVPEPPQEENDPPEAENAPDEAAPQAAAQPNVGNLTPNQIVAALLQQLQHGAPHYDDDPIDPVESDDPLNRHSRLGSTLYNKSAEALTTTWNGDHQDLAAFANALLLRARTFRWSTNGATDVVTITPNANPIGNAAGANHTGFNLFIDYRSITLEMVEQARAARTNPRAIQNSKAMFECIAASLTGRIHSLLFEQAGNLPIEDGPLLFIKAITCSQAIGTAATIDSIRRLDNFDPATVGYDIIKVNTTMFNLLNQAAAISGKAFSNDMQVAYMIKTYERIKQPEAWVRWVETQRAANPPPDCQSLANNAVSHASTLANQDSWSPSKLSPVETVQAMIAKFKSDKKPQGKGNPKGNDPKKRKDGGNNKFDKNKKPKKESGNKPPFVTYTTKGKNGPPHKVGDHKKWENTTYYFCDCPNHKDKLHWHSHEAKDCRTRLKWLKEKDGTGNDQGTGTDATANSATVDAPPSPRAYLGNLYREATSDAQRDQIASLLESFQE